MVDRLLSPLTSLPPPTRRLRLGVVGGGRGSFIGPVHAAGARLSGRWEVVAGALSSDPEVARASGREWLLPEDRIYTSYREMAEREAQRPDGIDAVAITTPNASHYPISVAFLAKGIDVICDKPLTNNLDEALDLLKRTREAKLVFGVTYSYAGHAMVRQAREMVLSGEVGEVRQIHVEYLQDWALGRPDQFSKGAAWRIVKDSATPSFTTGDIGTHAHHLGCFVTGLKLEKLRADFHVCGDPKPLEDTVFLNTRHEGGIPGTIMISQAAAGTHCGLRFRIFGSKAGLDWIQETPEVLHFNKANAPAQTLIRGTGAGIGPSATRLVRMPRGHPEALHDAWANIYAEYAIAIEARRLGREVPAGLLSFPDIVDGVLGVKFVDAAVQSNRAGGTWVDCTLKV
ncbi:MAG: Gfo/Idh/MocA family oxidoreductase [Rhizobiales bacterium]|nr:Gfo/Idh/MocA family oxidoreductase [Hyphomicrobiales bacterium]MBI3673872.1 Gfo/Idh/MocA family oxidoreductase [Hyphomicrobiales bacterium]